MVLIVFALMLTRRPTADASAEVTKNQPVAAAVSVLAAVGLGVVFVLTFGFSPIDVQRPGTAEHVGAAIFSDWVMGFEVVSVILLVALIAAIVLTGRTESRTGDADH